MSFNSICELGVIPNLESAMHNKSRQHTEQPMDMSKQKGNLAMNLSQAMAGKTQQRTARADDMAMSLNEAMAAKSNKRHLQVQAPGATGVGISLQQALDSKTRRDSQPAITYGNASPRLMKKSTGVVNRRQSVAVPNRNVRYIMLLSTFSIYM